MAICLTVGSNFYLHLAPEANADQLPEQTYFTKILRYLDRRSILAHHSRALLILRALLGNLQIPAKYLAGQKSARIAKLNQEVTPMTPKKILPTTTNQGMIQITPQLF